jgi:cytochrome c peroxidase
MQRITIILATLMLAAAGCASEEELVDGVFTPAEWEKVQTLSPLPEVPQSPTNKYADNPEAAKLGQRFFFEKSYSGPITVGDDGTNGGLGAAGETGKLACATCHSGEWFLDRHSKPNNASLGADWVPRNANSIVNAVYYKPWVENDGISDSFWSDALVDPEFNLALNGSRLRLAHVLYEKYKDDYNKVFDPDLDDGLDPAAADPRFPPEGKPGTPEWDAMAPADQEIVTTAFVNFGKAIEAYERQLVSGDAPFDRYVAGDTGAISASAKNGLKLFIGKANCVACHEGPHFSDDDFHVNGVAPEGEHIIPEETGREAVIQHVLENPFNSNGVYSDDRNTGWLDGLALTDAAKGQWRTKGLRQGTETAPYMHTGQFETLRDVVEFYNDGGAESGYVGVKDEQVKPLNLTDTEISDLVAFLESLTGAPVPEALQVDTSAQ